MSSYLESASRAQDLPDDRPGGMGLIHEYGVGRGGVFRAAMVVDADVRHEAFMACPFIQEEHTE